MYLKNCNFEILLMVQSCGWGRGGCDGDIFFFFFFFLLLNNCILKSSWSRGEGGGVELVEFLILNNCILKSLSSPSRSSLIYNKISLGW